MIVKGTFEMDILPDGQHVNMKLDFEQPLPEHAEKWLRFAYCNDLMWTIHAMTMNGTDVWMSTIKMGLYRHLLRHVHGDQYLVPEVSHRVDSAEEKSMSRIIKGRMWRVYFESLYERLEQIGKVDPLSKELREVVTSCIVIAKDATEAMEKVQREFPNERVNMLSENDNSFGSRRREETILL